MNRFHLPPIACQARPLVLEDKEAHHALHVLRLEAGNQVAVLDGQGGEFICNVLATARRSVELDIAEKRSHPRPPFQITLLQAIPKGKAIESIIQKATELGAHRIVPLLTDRTEIHLNHEQATKKTAKWRTIMVEAIKQCGNPWLPQLDEPVTLRSCLDRGEAFDLSLLASLEQRRTHPRVQFENYRKTHKSPPKSVAVWIGPEGDFSPGEQAAIEESGAHAISLGKLVLRADTAAIAALSVITHELSI